MWSELFLYLIGFFSALLATYLYQKKRKKCLTALGEAIIGQAEKESAEKKQALEITLREKALESEKNLHKVLVEGERKIAREREILAQKEERLHALTQRGEKKEQSLKEEELRLAQLTEICEKKLETLASLSSEEAKRLLLAKMEKEAHAEAAQNTLNLLEEAKRCAEKEAQNILITALNRLALPTTSEISTMTLSLPSDELKARIVGREGRNIRALEQATGVNFLIDDTPHAVVIAGFDPIRREIAKITLQELLKDGRIHPTRIEEVVEKAKKRLAQEIVAKGEDAALKAGAHNLHPTLLERLGKLYYRTSYGQNILQHSLEVAHLMGLLAGELRLDIPLAKRMGLLHDIGKGVTQEKEGSHALVGHELLLSYGESEIVANGVGCHHGEMPPQTPEAALVSIADAISAGKVGARSDTYEEYLNRLHYLENLSHQMPGVEKAYALQAGKELRVIVMPEKIDDTGAQLLARKLIQKLREDNRYPGKVQVTVVREKRIVEWS